MNGERAHDKKKDLRLIITRRLSQITYKEKENKEKEITERAIRFAEENGVRKAAVYISGEREVSTKNLKEKLFSLGVEVYAPKTYGENDMEFRKITKTSEYAPSRYGIPEPVDGEKEEEFDVIFVPLVAFDEENGRLGHGKGYYDKYLSRYGKNAVKIGLAFEEQKVDKVPTEENDIRLDDVFYS